MTIFEFIAQVVGGIVAGLAMATLTCSPLIWMSWQWWREDRLRDRDRTDLRDVYR